jgi:hypothetical protein
MEDFYCCGYVRVEIELMELKIRIPVVGFCS